MRGDVGPLAGRAGASPWSDLPMIACMVGLLARVLPAIWSCTSLSASSDDINGLRANIMVVILNVTLVDDGNLVLFGCC